MGRVGWALGQKLFAQFLLTLINSIPLKWTEVIVWNAIVTIVLSGWIVLLTLVKCNKRDRKWRLTGAYLNILCAVFRLVLSKKT